MADYEEEGFRWSPDLVEDLIGCLRAYKSTMELKQLDFNGDKPVQYETVRKHLAKIHRSKEELFGPISCTTLPDFPAETSVIAEAKAQIKKDTDLIKKGSCRVQEKIKEIRQSFSHAVASGSRSGSGKIVHEHYDMLKEIYAGSPCTEPLASGVDTDSLLAPDGSSEAQPETRESGPSDTLDVLDEYESDTEVGSKDRSAKLPTADTPNQIPRLVDNKRKHLEKQLSASKRDQLLIEEAKEDRETKKGMAEAIKESSASFQTAMAGMQTTMSALAQGMPKSMEMLAHAMMQQPQPAPMPNYQMYGNNAQSPLSYASASQPPAPDMAQWNPPCLDGPQQFRNLTSDSSHQ
eukprot:scpid36433/ scgid28591/ 